LQNVEQPSLQLPEHWNAHEPLHATAQLLLQDVVSEEAFEIKGTLINATAPKIGNTPFAAFLKNSRLLCSSSFFLFFVSITHKPLRL